jgi:hypothetical protein
MRFLHIPKRNILQICMLASQCAYVLLDIDTVYSCDISRSAEGISTQFDTTERPFL